MVRGPPVADHWYKCFPLFSVVCLVFKAPRQFASKRRQIRDNSNQLHSQDADVYISPVGQLVLEVRIDARTYRHTQYKDLHARIKAPLRR